MTDGSDAAPRSILAVTSGPAEAGPLLRAAAALARRHGAALSVLVPVAPPPDLAAAARATVLTADGLAARIADEAQQAVAAAAAGALGALGAPLRVEARIGKPFLEVVRHVAAEGIDLVVKTAEPPTGLRRLLLASTDQHLLRKCPCAVWLRRPETPEMPRRVVAAVDVAADGADIAERDDMNRRLLGMARHLAGDAAVEVLHVWDAPGEGLVRRWAADPAAAIATYAGGIEAERRSALRALIGSMPPGPRLVPVLVRGQPRGAIPAELAARGADLLVIGTVARGGLGGVLIGNTAEDVVNAVECSVLALKPAGFVSPVLPPPGPASA